MFDNIRARPISAVVCNSTSKFAVGARICPRRALGHHANYLWFAATQSQYWRWPGLARRRPRGRWLVGKREAPCHYNGAQPSVGCVRVHEVRNWWRRRRFPFDTGRALSSSCESTQQRQSRLQTLALPAKLTGGLHTATHTLGRDELSISRQFHTACSMSFANTPES